MTERPSGAGSLEGLGDLGDVDRRHLHEQRLIGHLAAGSHNGRGALGVEPMAAPPAAILGQLTLIS